MAYLDYKEEEMKRPNLLLNLVVTLTAISLCALFSFAAEGNLSSPLPSTQGPSEKEGKGVKLELTPPVPVSPTIEAEGVPETTTPESAEDLEELEEEAQAPSELQEREIVEEAGQKPKIQPAPSKER